MMERPDLQCEACSYNAPLKAYEVPPATGIDGKYTNFCRLCVSTRAGNIYWHPLTRENADVLYAVCFVGNAILDALGLLWPDEEAPTGIGPSALEIERDTLNIRVLELDEQIKSLDKQCDAAIDDRDAVIHGRALDVKQLEQTVDARDDQIAELSARLAVLQPSIPEKTEDHLEDPSHG